MTDAPDLSNADDAQPDGPHRSAPRTWFAAAVLAYVVFIGGFAAWHAAAVWSWSRITSMVAIPAGLVCVQFGPNAWRALGDRLPLSFLFAVVAPILMALFLGGMGLAVAYLVVESVGHWENRTLRTAVAAGGLIVCAAATWIAYDPARRQPKSRS